MMLLRANVIAQGLLRRAAGARRPARRDAQRRAASADPGAGQRRRERRPRAARAPRARADRRGRPLLAAATSRRRAAMLARRRARARDARAQGRDHAHQRHAGAHRRRRARRGRRAPPLAASRTSPARCRSRRCSARRSHSMRASRTRADSSARRRARRCCASCSRDSEIRESHREGDPRVQDPYALRCMPQVHGPVLDAIDFCAGVDRPRAQRGDRQPARLRRHGELLSGGNFHGQAVAMALDFLAIALTNLATIAERRIDRLVHPDLNQGLPPFLTRDAGRQLRLHDGAGDRGVARERVQGARRIRRASTRSRPTATRKTSCRWRWARRGSCGASSQNVRHVLAIELMCAAQGLDYRAPLRAGRGARARARARARSSSPPLDAGPRAGRRHRARSRDAIDARTLHRCERRSAT